MINPNKVPIFATLRAHRHTRDGRIVFWGSIAQLPLMAMMFWKAWNTFPLQGTEELLLAGFLHLGVPIGLTGAYIKKSCRSGFSSKRRPDNFFGIDRLRTVLYIAALPALMPEAYKPF